MRRGLVGLGCLALVAAGTGAAVGAAPAWQEHVYKQDGFAVTSPTTPKLTTRSVKSPDGKVDVHAYESDFPDADHPYQVIVSRYPADVDEKAIVSFVQKLQLSAAKDAKLSDEQAVTLDGAAGADYTVTFPEATFHVRLLVKGDTTYQATVSWRTGAAPGDFDRFIKSFRFVTE
jgi:hypothetical protein